MREIMESGFLILHDTKKAGSVNNVFWALWHAQYPLKNPEHDKRIAGSINWLVSCSLSRKSEITLVSSSYGTVVAAQLALYLVKNRERLGLSPEPLNLVFASSMISKESRLFNELEALKSKKLIGAIVYDDLQYPGDNVTGMCGKTRLQAIREVRRIAFPLAGTYKGQPSILNKDPLNGHVHRKRELSTDKVNDYIAKPLVDHELAGPYYRARALNYLSR
jgi:hypothetical protein